MENVTSEPILIPGIRRATIRMLSEQYHIPYAILSNRYHYYKDNFSDDDAVIPKTKEEFEAMLPPDVQFAFGKKTKGTLRYIFDNAAYLSFKPGNTPLFSEKAVRRLIELCSEEHNAKKGIRKDKAADEAKPKSAETQKRSKCSKPEFENKEEEALCLRLAKAYRSGDNANTLLAALALDSYRQRTIQELTKMLEEENAQAKTPWTSRMTGNKLASFLSEVTGIRKKDVWIMIYNKLMYEYNIPLTERNKSPLISGLKDNEWYLFYQAFTDICKEKYLNVEQIMKKSDIDTRGLSLVVKY